MNEISNDELLSCSLNYQEFDKENNQFIFREKDSDLKIYFNYKLEISEMKDINDYEIHLFYNKNFAENNIFQVFDGDIRLGWLFPLQAIISQNHDYVSNEYFLNYAYIAFLKLLVESEKWGKRLIYRDDCNYRLEDLYDIEYTHVFVTSNSNTNTIREYNFQNYIPSLYDKGYLSRPGDNNKTIDSQNKIKLNKISVDLTEEVFIKYLFNEILVEKIHPLVKFHMLYQVIELLIERIFNFELKILLDGLSKNEKKLFQVKEDLGNIANESDRIKKLFNNYSEFDASRDELKDSCNELLDGVGRDRKNNAAKALYNVRNLYVHDYRSIPSEFTMHIDQINILFEKVVIETIHTFKLNE
ncbi:MULTISPECIES: hypothetical protein [unclassified Viridibacillus]|uniref:hypothetical protein n=1 Tax=unclassified Viridibacillus TaxID=2617942 RepID=UPI00096C3B96|nr:hypothetical protein [Viridibacillus sp. FSL H8-0123]OMC81430.1 hypothetical protein BK130_14880 [Viridibacillus sp. FSL H8-0123]